MRDRGRSPELTLPDPDRRYASVRLWQELGLPGDQTEFTWREGRWTLPLPEPARLPVRRLQYLFEVATADGERELIPDPANPLRAGGPFGEHSVLELPGYARPSWLDVEAAEGSRSQLTAGGLDVAVWSPAGVGPADRTPLLFAHDGPELDQYAALTRWAAAMVERGDLPPFRVALLPPGERNTTYAASPAYARTLTADVVPALRAGLAVRGPLVAVGASLGALAALHAEWTVPGTFGALYLASGSFFTVRTDSHEIRSGVFWPVAGFVHEVLTTDAAPTRAAVALVCGSAEENAANNRLLARGLGCLGLAVDYAEIPDIHVFTAWRDGWDPHLTRLCRRVWEDG